MIEKLNHVIHPQIVTKEQSFETQVALFQHKYLIGDKERIHQILLNILSNYTPSGGRVRLQINELPQVDLNYSRIRFIINDNGQGISEKPGQFNEWKYLCSKQIR